MDGIINVYKPMGMTSHDVVYKVRKITGIKKVGHTGTLDPDADGVLPICIGKGTKLSDMLMFSDKAYRTAFRLGISTDTQDIGGSIISEKEVTASKEEIISTINSFVGEYSQLPPMYSAVKIDGKKLYELARKGVEVERKKRTVKIYSIDIEKIEKNDVTVLVNCSKGTYIRTLCNDIGDRLGCGGTVVKLTRTLSGAFDIKKSVTLEELRENGAEKYLVPCDEMFDYEKIEINGENLRRVLNGNSIRFEVSDGKRYRVYDDNGKFLCVSEGKGSELVLVKSFY